MPDHGLSLRQLETIRAILAPHRGTITKAGLFGSRALGTYRPNSDIDLVLYGPIPEAIITDLKSAFEESILPMRVDVVAYDLITYPPLKAHIDAVMQPLYGV
ncbi:MAG: nucleotidyltransferase family protein [Holosporales bacterium]